MTPSYRMLMLLGAVAGLVCAASADAQAQSSRVTGTVRDAQGAPVAGARVTATNLATGGSRSTTTSADGTYTVSGLAQGSYAVSASVFAGAASRATVQLAEAATVDLALAPVQLQALTVTSMLREQALDDVPFSVAAPTAQVLRSRGVDNLEGISANVAGFNLQNLGPGQNQVAMRGASAGQIARDQPGVKEQVGVYLDNLPISLSLFTPDLDLFDLSRVEVLRGPQGTLYGSGSLGGTVRYISNQPELGVQSVFGEVGGSMIAGGSAGGNLKAGVNLPLGANAAARVAGYYNALGGYMDAVQPDPADPRAPRLVDENVNSGTRSGVRAALRFAPNQRFTITPQLIYQSVKMDGWNRIDAFNILANPYTTSREPVTLGKRQLFTQIDEPFTDDFLVGGLNLNYNMGGTNLTSVTSFTSRDILVVRDAGALTASITGGSIGLTENVYTLDAPLDDATTSKVFTQEVRLAGGSDRLRWVAGAFYSANQRDYGQSLLVAGFQTASGIPTVGLRAARDVLFFSDLSYDLKQFAVFGEGTYTVSDRLNLTAGLRYYNFDEDRDQVFDGIFAHDSTGREVVSVPGSTSANGLAPRFIASLKASDALTLNAQVARGVRLGGINDPLNTPLCSATDSATFSGRGSWKSETTWNYEVGGKSTFLGGRGSLNVSAFNMDISDLQLIVTAGTCSSRLVFNVPKSRSRGLEAEFSLAPGNNFDFAVSASINNSELRSTLTSTDTLGQVRVVSGIQEGNRLPSVPEFQASAGATYKWQLNAASQAFVGGSFQHVGSHYTQIDDLAANFGTVDMTDLPNTIGGPLTQLTFTFDPELPAYSLINLRAGVTRARWEVALYVNNLTDERALLALDRERGTLARVGYLTNQPRTFGLTMRISN
jgi:iron complex outermembrane recepter protein